MLKRRRQVNCMECLSVQADEVEVDARLCEWARWCVRRGGSPDIGSLEGRYRSPQHWHRVEPTMPIILRQVLDVERMLVAMPELERALLRGWYVYRRSPGDLCRRLAIHWQLFPARLRYARLMLRNLLRLGHEPRNVAPQQFAPTRSHAETIDA